MSRATANGDIVDPKTNEIATAQPAVYGEIEHRRTPMAQTSFGPQGLFRSTRRPLHYGALNSISVHTVDLHGRSHQSVSFGNVRTPSS